jgi:hypothetical protein
MSSAGAAVEREEEGDWADNKTLDQRAVELVLISLLADFCGRLVV